jgi:hypothetical protein
MTIWHILLGIYCVCCAISVIFVRIITEPRGDAVMHLLLTVVFAVTAPVWIPISFGAKTVYKFLG